MKEKNELSVQEHAINVPSIETKTVVEYMDAFGLSTKLEPNEKKAFINIAQEFGLNPFKREIYCVAYGQGQYRTLSIVTGYEVYLKRAERIGKLDGWNVQTKGTGNDMVSVVTIHRKDWAHPFVHEVYFREVVQTKKDGGTNSFWGKMPAFMTKKVAIAQAFRLCFPDEFGGLPYTNDELGVDKIPEEPRNVTEPLPEKPVEQEQEVKSVIIHETKNPIEAQNIDATNEYLDKCDVLIQYIDTGMFPSQLSRYIEACVNAKADIESIEKLLEVCKHFEETEIILKTDVLDVGYDLCLETIGTDKNKNTKERIDTLFAAAEKAKDDDVRYFKALELFAGLM